MSAESLRGLLWVAGIVVLIVGITRIGDPLMLGTSDSIGAFGLLVTNDEHAEAVLHRRHCPRWRRGVDDRRVGACRAATPTSGRLGCGRVGSMGYDLPPDRLAGDSFSYSEAVGYLDRLVGQEVVVWVDLDSVGAQLMSAGRLRRIDAPVADAFSVGTAVVTLPAAGSFTFGALSTFDGSDFFTLDLSFGSRSIAFGQPDLHGSDYQEAVWARYLAADEGA